MKELIMKALKEIPPSKLTYDEWIRIGMALKTEDFSFKVFNDWSKNDSRYDEADAKRHWESFNRGEITAGTIFYLAETFGFKPKSNDVQRDENEVINYINNLFMPDDIISVSNEVIKKANGKYAPVGGYFTKASNLTDAIKEKGLDKAVSYNHEAGLCIILNPVDGEGRSDRNVVAFKYVLVESDDTPIHQQRKDFERIHLPIASIVHSGNKSLHALVRIDAEDYDEYNKRVRLLYDYIAYNGVSVDYANKNPSRNTRLPGAERNGKRQYLIATNIGPASWEDFYNDYLKFCQNDYPPIESLCSYYNNPPSLPKELIEGILRVGHKLLISGPSKAGKSFLLMELAIAIAEGTEWLGYRCLQGAILYINLEIDAHSAINRFLEIYKKIDLSPSHINNIDIWNLRGHAQPLESLACAIIDFCKDKNYIAVIIDPIYKIQNGDENSARDIAFFCNSLDRICSAMNCAVIYAHHHSKGEQGRKSTIDRASGSGVFARDADALLDMSPLVITEGSAFRVTSALREFKDVDSFNVRFDYPIHIVDDSEELVNAPLEGTSSGNRAKGPNNSNRAQRKAQFDKAFNELYKGNPVSVHDLAKQLQLSSRTIREWTKDFGDSYKLEKGYIWRNMGNPDVPPMAEHPI